MVAWTKLRGYGINDIHYSKGHAIFAWTAPNGMLEEIDGEGEGEGEGGKVTALETISHKTEITVRRSRRLIGKSSLIINRNNTELLSPWFLTSKPGLGGVVRAHLPG